MEAPITEPGDQNNILAPAKNEFLRKSSYHEVLENNFVAWGLHSRTVAKGFIPYRFIRFSSNGDTGLLSVDFSYVLEDDMGTLSGAIYYTNSDGQYFFDAGSRKSRKLAIKYLPVPEKEVVGHLQKLTFGRLREEDDPVNPLEFDLVVYCGKEVADFQKSLEVSASVPLWSWDQQLVTVNHAQNDGDMPIDPSENSSPAE